MKKLLHKCLTNIKKSLHCKVLNLSLIHKTRILEECLKK